VATFEVDDVTPPSISTEGGPPGCPSVCVCVCVANDILTDRRVSTVTGVNRCSPRRCQYEIIYHNQRASTPTLAVCCWRRPPPPLRSSSQTTSQTPWLHGTRLSHQPDVRGASSSPEGGRLQSSREAPTLQNMSPGAAAAAGRHGGRDLLFYMATATNRCRHS